MAVQVILQEHIESLGEAGDVVNVKNGYARNYLLPGGHAVLATMPNLVKLKEVRQELKEQADQKKEEVMKQKSAVEAVGDIEVKAEVGPIGKLFGRVTGSDIAEIIKEKSQIEINRKNIKIINFSRGVDELGEYQILIDLGLGINAGLKLNVVEEVEG